MSRIVQVRKNGEPIQGLFRKLSTEADVFRFVGSESGKVLLIHKNDSTVLPDGRQKVTIGPNYPAPNNTPEYIEFVLDFQYFVGLNQLQALYVPQSGGAMGFILSRSAIDRSRQAWSGWDGGAYDADLDPDDPLTRHFQEISPDTVRVMNPGVLRVFGFMVPHTSLQATSRNRLTIENQGDNQAIDMLGRNDGIVFTSPSGKRGILRMDDNFLVGVDRI
jgi:hypothetical protein